MKILLTNDDGVRAPGIWAAARTLAEIGSVTIVAPAQNYSGFGAALPATKSIDFNSYSDEALGHNISNVAAYGLSTTPAACAQVGLSGTFGGPYDLVVSGINLGANMGHDVFYSGTVGAALTAQLMGIPAIAMSLDAEAVEDAHWETAQWALREAIRMWQTQRESKPIVFNVNVPNRPAAALAGMQLTSFSSYSFLAAYQFEPDPAQPGTLVATYHRDGHAAKADKFTDAWAVAQGYVSVTPLRPFPELLAVAPLSRSMRTAPRPAPVRLGHLQPVPSYS
jgi:5'-nucleotidase